MSVSLKRHVPIYSFIYHIRKIAVTEIRRQEMNHFLRSNAIVP